MSNIKLRNTYKSYTAIFVIGILVGCICRLLDYFPADTLWSFFITSNIVWFLDYYQYYHRYVKHLKYLCRN